MAYQEGQRLQGSDGKTYRVVNGVPREEGAAMPAAPQQAAPAMPQAAPQAPAPQMRPPAFIPGIPKPEKPRDPPSGYNWGQNGELIPITGGPEDPNAPQNQPKGANGGQPTVDERKIATLLTRIAGGASDIQATTHDDPAAA